MAAHLNEGVDTLKKPVKRAIYLLKLQGIDVDFEKNTAMSPMFLMDQMELREQLEVVGKQADPFVAIDVLYERIAIMQKERIEDFKAAYNRITSDIDSDGNNCHNNNAEDIVAEMQFVEKLRIDVERLEETLD